MPVNSSGVTLSSVSAKELRLPNAPSTSAPNATMGSLPIRRISTMPITRAMTTADTVIRQRLSRLSIVAFIRMGLLFFMSFQLSVSAEKELP